MERFISGGATLSRWSDLFLSAFYSKKPGIGKRAFTWIFDCVLSINAIDFGLFLIKIYKWLISNGTDSPVVGEAAGASVVEDMEEDVLNLAVEMTEEGVAATKSHRCTKRFAMTAARHVNYHFVRQATSRYFAGTVLPTMVGQAMPAVAGAAMIHSARKDEMRQ